MDDEKALASDDQPGRTLDAKQELQRAVSEVRSHRTERPVEEVVAAIETAIAARGLPEQPAPWVRATAEEIARGHRVVVDARDEQPDPDR